MKFLHPYLTQVILFRMPGFPALAQKRIDLQVECNYLHLPVSYDEEDHARLEMVIDGKVVRDFDIFLPGADPDFWVFLDISRFKGKKAFIRSSDGEEKKGLELVYQSDDRKYLYNVYQEKRRPQLHFSSMRGWINDPNGLVYYDGEYHLFYQHNPYGYWWGNMHWGHAVSTDLVHWDQQPEALYPDEVGVCFSGCVVIDYDNTSGFKTGDEEVMVAIYTSTFFPDEAQEEAGLDVMERQSLAYSNYRGRTWTKHEGNPVIGNFDGKAFTVESGPHTYVEGDLFASQTFENIPESDGRQIQMSWATIPTPGMPFNNMMGFPTELTLRSTNDGIRMFNEPVSEIGKLHTQSATYEVLTVDEANKKLMEVSSERLHLKFEVESINVMRYGLSVGGDNISYTIRTNNFIFNDEEKVFKYAPDRPSKRISYEVIVDRTSLEVFLNRGHFTMVLPRDLDSDKQGVEFWTENGTDLKIHNLEIHEMKSTWNNQ